MKIREIYKNFRIPPNLRDHMFRVYSVICLIETHWKGKKVDWNLAKKTALLHDLGNIIKFKQFIGLEESSIEYWKQVQKEMIKKYGSDEEGATKIMLRKVGVDERVIQIIEMKAFANSVGVKDSNDWRLKLLLYYADLRTLPLTSGDIRRKTF